MLATNIRFAILLSLLFVLAASGLSSPGKVSNLSVINVQTPRSGVNNSKQGTNERVGTEDHNATSNAEPSGDAQQGASYKLFYSEQDEIEEIKSRKTPRRFRARVQTFFFQVYFQIRDSVRTRMARSQMTAHERRAVDVYKKTLPAVVELKVYHALNSSEISKIAEEHQLEEGQTPCSVSTVSGFLWDDKGHIVTNHHCLYGKEREDIVKVKVRFPNFKDFLDAEVIGSDPSSDLGVLKVSSKQYNPAFSSPLKLLPKPIPKGSSRYLQVGQTCHTVGAPNGRSNSFTSGVVSSLDQYVKATCTENRYGMYGCVQTDAVIGPGSSGGPLLDTQGRLIGIIFAMHEDALHGFAIPVDTAKRAVGQIIQSGQAKEGTSGIVFVGDDLQQELELGEGSEFGGILVKEVPPNCPADVAGLQGAVVFEDVRDSSSFLEARDLIVGLDGKRVTNLKEYLGILESMLPGQKALVTVSRVARIGDVKRWKEVIPIKLVTYDELSVMSEQARKILQENRDNQE